MRICFATADPNGPQGWWRAHVPAAMLAARHHEAYSCAALTTDDRGRLRPVGVRQPLRPPQALILQGWYHPQGPELVRRARAAGQLVFVDLDDDVWNIPATNPAHDAAQAWRPHLEALMAVCDAVVCSTPAVATAALQHADAVAVARNGIPARMCAADIDTARPSGRVGWLGRTPYRGADLASIAPALQHLAAKGAMTTFTHYGATEGDPSAAAVAGLDDVATEARPWTHIETLANDLRLCDLVVVPQVDSPFARARSNATGLLCAAAGVPFIATPTPEYQLLHHDGAGGLAETADEWADLAAHVLADPLARVEWAADGLAALGRAWTAEQTAGSWADTIAAHHQCARDARQSSYAPRGVRGG